MIRTYKKFKKNRTKVFFVVNSDGSIISIKTGNQVVAVEQGFQFYVDDYVAEQINKCELYIDGLTPKLRVKDGETLIVPEENDEYKKRKEIKELEERLQELKADRKSVV